MAGGETPKTMQTRADWLRHGSNTENNINVDLVMEHSAPCGQDAKGLSKQHRSH